jgi:hypothetical protein
MNIICTIMKNIKMKEKLVKFRDPIIEKVCDQLVERSDVGFKKYGVTLEDDMGDLTKWLQHLQEELLDAVNYIEKLKTKL